MRSNFDGDGIIIERWLMKAFPHTIDGGNPKRTQLVGMYSVYILCYRYLNTPKRLRVYSCVHYYKLGMRENSLSHS